VRAGEAARRAGVNVETLRYYERRGLLPEPTREPGGHRRYDEEAVRFLRAIKEAQGIGFTLAEIEEYLRVVRAGPVSASQALRVRMAAKIDEIDARIAGLRRMRDELARIVGCACESLDHCTCGAAYLARRGRDSSARPSPLHVTNGESAGNTLRQTSLGGAVLPWQDVLHEGPLPAGSRRGLLRTRAAFLSACGWGSSRAILSSLERRDGRLLQALRDRQHVVLWFEHDLYDQLQLLDVLALASSANSALEMIVVGSFPGKPWFRGLGELTADQLETLWPSRVTASHDTLAAAASAWDAVRRPEPSALAALARRDDPQLPFLGPALRRLLEELPAPQDGLSGTERRALRAIAAGATTPAAAFRAEQDLEDAPFLGDAWFYRTLSILGRGEPRLIATRDDQPLPAAPPLGDAHAFTALSLKLTPAGERVLSQKADRVTLVGVDRWVGGTHITPATAWRWDPAAQLLSGPVLPGSGGRAVAVQDLGAAGVPRGGGAVRVQHEGPAPPVDDDLMVEETEQDAVLDAGRAAVGLVLDVVDLAGGGGLGAPAGPPAVLIAQGDGVPDGGRDGVGVADVQRQARPAQPGAELLAAQEGRQPAGTRYERDGLADDRPFERLAGQRGRRGGGRAVRRGRGRSRRVPGPGGRRVRVRGRALVV